MLVVALVATVLAVAYGVQSPSLAVAEFAPAARQAIEPPPTTTNDNRGAGGATNRRRPTTTLPPASASTSAPSAEAGGAPTTRAARTRSCVGSPPRQIEDLLSPACVAAIFEDDNGGNTARGVSQTEIRVAVAASGGLAGATSGSTKAQRDALLGLFDFFNRRFELYGRRLVPVIVEGAASDALGARSLATQVAAADVFGAINAMQFFSGNGLHSAFGQELARNGVVTVVHNRASWWSDRIHFDPHHPYLWSTTPSAEELQSDLGAVACSLANKPASFTQDGDLAGHTRRFGIIAAGVQSTPSASNLASQLETCSGSAPARIDWNRANDPTQSLLRTAINKFAAEGVTSVICVCESIEFDQPTSQMFAINYSPEFLYVKSDFSQGDEYVGSVLRNNRGLNLIQIQPGPRTVPLQARPWFGALMSTSSVLSGDASSYQGAFTMADLVYEQLLVLASGIQAAGPHLTPDTFANGLMAAQFPNPSAGTAPDWQPLVGFGPGDHAFYDGFAVAWWSDTAPMLEPFPFSTFKGSWCYAGIGARYQAATVPANLDEMLFRPDLPCR